MARGRPFSDACLPYGTGESGDKRKRRLFHRRCPALDQL